MKIFLQSLLITIFIMQMNLFAQSPIVQQIIDLVNLDSLVYFVRELSGDVPTMINGTSQTILSRNKYQPGNALAETYIKQKLQSYGLTTTIQSFSTTGKNVFAVQPGSESINQKYLICAHFDDMPTGTIAPGAYDNASGTSQVIEAARILSQYSFPFTIVYALWDEEELNGTEDLVGSTYYATLAAGTGDSILGVINLDGPCYDPNGDGVVEVHNRSVGSTIQLYNNMVDVNSQYGIDLNIASRNPGVYASDHGSFWSAGYGAIMLSEDYKNERHPYVHNINDRIQYFNLPYFLKASKLAIGTMAVLSLNLNFDIFHTPIDLVIAPQTLSTNSFISTGLEIGNGSLAPRMYYRNKETGGSYGDFNEVVGTSTGNGNYSFSIPSLSNGTFVQYYLAAQDTNSTIVRTMPSGGGGFNPPGSTAPDSFFQFFEAELIEVASDEANNITDWTSIGGWNVTTEKYVSPPSSFTDSPGGNYSSNANTSLRYNNQIGVINALNAFLEYDAQWAIEGTYDYGQIQLSTNNGINWIPLAGRYTVPGTDFMGLGSTQPMGEPLYDGTQATWIHEIIDISNYANHQISFRFLLKSDYSVNLDGLYIDNLKTSVYATILGQRPYVDKTYARKNIDSVLFRIKLLNFYNHQFTPHLIYANTDSTDIDSLTIFDDGFHGDSLANDEIYGAYIPPRSTESFYTLSISTVDHQTNDYINSSDIRRFTTVGPVVLDSIFCLNSSTYYNVQTFVRNQSSITTITNAQVKLLCDDPWVLSISPSLRYLPNIPPGDVVSNPAIFTVKQIDSLFPGYFNFKVEVMSNGWTYWKDSLVITPPNDVEDELNPLPTEFSLVQNYPNPFNSSSVIKYSIPKSSRVSLKIFNALGQELETLVNEEKSTGTYELTWNASNLPSGVYFYRLQAGSFVQTRKMILMK